MIEYECCFCGKKFQGFGNNPWPLVKDMDSRCCDECNRKVIEARIKQLKENEDGNK